VNIERYRMVMHRIWADLRSWDQVEVHSDNWYDLQPSHEPPKHICGTSHCVAGWAHILSGGNNYQPTYQLARDWLELSSDEEMYWLRPEARQGVPMTEAHNLTLEFELRGDLYFSRGTVEGPSVLGMYRCHYHVVDWTFCSERFERWDELSQRWIHCQLGEPMSTLFHRYQQMLLDAELSKRLGCDIEDAA